MSNFIEDFLSYNVGTECPTNFLRWAALSAIGIAAGLRYSLPQGRIKITPEAYIIFIAKQGTKKTYAIDQVRDIIRETFPDHPLGANLTSRDNIIKYMHDNCERAYTDEDGNTGTIYYPMTFLINEFKHFISYNASSMISFFVDIYGQKTFDCSTNARAEEFLTRPCLNILAAENTDWMVNNLKQGIITGGFSRRFIVVYEPDDVERIIPKPYLPANHKELWERMKSHLQDIHSNHARYQWTPEADSAFDEWYHRHKKSMPEDETVRGFMRSKDQQLLKIAMRLDLAESKPSYKITTDLLDTAHAMFDLIEPNMPRLYIAAGRNEYAVPQQEVLELLRNNKGCLAERQFFRATDKNMDPMTKFGVIKNLNQMGYIVRLKAPDGEWGREGVYFMSIERYAKAVKGGGKFTLLNPV